MLPSWPDSLPDGGATVDDVSRMSSTPVSRVTQPTTEREVLSILSDCLANGVKLSPRGTQHSMGGERDVECASSPLITRLTHLDSQATPLPVLEDVPLTASTFASSGTIPRRRMSLVGLERCGPILSWP